jgi:hypothetical protein
MTERNHCRIYAVSKQLSPLTHNQGAVGNETIIFAEQWVHGSEIVTVPAISGNALRHRCVRAPGAMHLIEELGISGKVKLEVLQFLFAGGSLTKGGAVTNVKRLTSLWNAIPLIRILGGSLPDQIVPGTLQVWRGLLVCEENRERLKSSVPTDWLPADMRFYPAHRWYDSYQYTRTDPSKALADMIDVTPDEKATKIQMIYSGQTIGSGACWLHGYDLRGATEVDIGCLLHALSGWDETIGGMSGRGHGRMKTTYHIEPEVDVDGLIDRFKEHQHNRRDEAFNILDKEFGMEAMS